MKLRPRHPAGQALGALAELVRAVPAAGSTQSAVRISPERMAALTAEVAA